MGAIATMLADWSKRSGTARPSQWLIDWARGGAESSSGISVSERSALMYTPFWAGVRVISGTLAALPFKVYRRTKGGKQPEPNHPIYRLLHDRPNEYMDAVTFVESRQAHVLTYGNGYAEIQRNGAGRPVALWPLLPDRTSRKMTEDGLPYYEVRLSAGGTVTLRDENVLHVKGLGFDGYTGYNVVAYHKEALGYGIAVKQYGARFFANDANPGGVLEHPNQLSATAKKHLEDSWNAAHAGLSHAHRMQILEEGMKWNKVGIDPEQAQALQVQKWTVDDAARILQIPPHKLGSMEYSKYANVEQLNLDFYCSTMLYWFRKWEQEVNAKLLMPGERGRLFCEILVDALLRGNVEARTRFYASGRQWGFLSINDIREKENMNPIGPAGDVYLDPLNMVPAGGLGPGGGQEASVREAHRALIASQWARVIEKQTKAVQGGNGDFSYERQRIWALKVLAEPVNAYASLRRIGRVQAERILDSVIAETITEDRKLEPSHVDLLTDRLMEQIGGNDNAVPQ